MNKYLFLNRSVCRFNILELLSIFLVFCFYACLSYVSYAKGKLASDRSIIENIQLDKGFNISWCGPRFLLAFGNNISEIDIKTKTINTIKSGLYDLDRLSLSCAADGSSMLFFSGSTRNLYIISKNQEAIYRVVDRLDQRSSAMFSPDGKVIFSNSSLSLIKGSDVRPVISFVPKKELPVFWIGKKPVFLAEDHSVAFIFGGMRHKIIVPLTTEATYRCGNWLLFQTRDAEDKTDVIINDLSKSDLQPKKIDNSVARSSSGSCLISQEGSQNGADITGIVYTLFERGAVISDLSEFGLALGAFPLPSKCQYAGIRIPRTNDEISRNKAYLSLVSINPSRCFEEKL